MKIVFLDTTMSGSQIGGAHTFLVKIMGQLSRCGHQVHLISNGAPRAKTAANIENSGAIIHTKLWNRSLLVEDATPILADWINKLNPDVYVISVSPDIGWTVLPYLNSNIATHTIGHNDSEAFYQPAKYYSEYLTRAIGVSSEICRKYTEECKIPAERVEWIPYGVESIVKQVDNINSDEQKLSLVYVGRLEDEQKRASDLLKIVKKLTEEEIKFEFKIIGDGALKNLFEEELRTEISGNKVQLLGWLKSEELLNHLANSDILLLTSAYEGFCISLVEAMANGCCPIVTAIASGNQQIVQNNVNGYIVPVGDTEKFVKQIKLLAGNGQKLLNMRQKALITGKEYSIEKMVNSYYECFLQSTSEAKENPRQINTKFPLMATCRSKYPLWLRRIKAKTKQLVSVG